MNVFVPPVSPFGLIQEVVWPDRWLLIVCCMMLNQTSRKQVERVLPQFRALWPDPVTFLHAQPNEVEDVCHSLGFAKRRTQNLLKMTRTYLTTDWSDPRQLPGVGEYGARSYEIFCGEKLGDEPPKDHALSKYYAWVQQHGLYERTSDEQRTEDNRETTGESTS